MKTLTFYNIQFFIVSILPNNILFQFALNFPFQSLPNSKAVGRTGAPAMAQVFV